MILSIKSDVTEGGAPALTEPEPEPELPENKAVEPARADPDTTPFPVADVSSDTNVCPLGPVLENALMEDDEFAAAGDAAIAEIAAHESTCFEISFIDESFFVFNKIKSFYLTIIINFFSFISNK
jgi:hypothetical protein